MTASHQVAIEMAHTVIREEATTVPGQKQGVFSRLGCDSEILMPGSWIQQPRLPARPGNLDFLNARDLTWSDFGPQHARFQVSAAEGSMVNEGCHKDHLVPASLVAIQVLLTLWSPRLLCHYSTEKMMMISETKAMMS